MRPVMAFSCYPSASRAFPFLLRNLHSGFAIHEQARQLHAAESSSSSYRLAVLLQLLPTPPHGDAVTFGYRPESIYLKRTFTSLSGCAHRRTSSRSVSGSGFSTLRCLPHSRHNILDSEFWILLVRGQGLRLCLIRAAPLLQQIRQTPLCRLVIRVQAQDQAEGFGSLFYSILALQD